MLRFTRQLLFSLRAQLIGKQLKRYLYGYLKTTWLVYYTGTRKDMAFILSVALLDNVIGIGQIGTPNYRTRTHFGQSISHSLPCDCIALITSRTGNGWLSNDDTKIIAAKTRTSSFACVGCCRGFEFVSSSSHMMICICFLWFLFFHHVKLCSSWEQHYHS